MSDVNVSGTPAEATPSATPAAATPAAPSAVAPATPQATPQTPATGAPGDGWVPSYRIREAREAAERQANEGWSKKEADYQSQLARVQQQLHALVGVQPKQNTEVDAVKQQF